MIAIQLPAAIVYKRSAGILTSRFDDVFVSKVCVSILKLFEFCAVKGTAEAVAADRPAN